MISKPLIEIGSLLKLKQLELFCYYFFIYLPIIQVISLLWFYAFLLYKMLAVI